MSGTKDANEKQDHHHHHEVRIHIDQTRYESPNPTSGEALYALGHVTPGLYLFREVHGDREDPVIENGPEVIHLKEDEHFHSGPPKELMIIVNGRKKSVTQLRLSFDQVVALAFSPVPTGPNVLFAVSYSRGPKVNPEGELAANGTVRLKEGMVFLVTETDKS